MFIILRLGQSLASKMPREVEAIPSLLDFIGDTIGDALSTFTMSRLWCVPTSVMH